MRSDTPALDKLKLRLELFVGRTESVIHAAVVSPDGHPVTCTTRLDTDATDELAAITANVVAYTRAAARCLGSTAPKQAITELADDRVLCVVLLGDGTHLAILAATADRERLAFDLCRLVELVNDYLTGSGPYG